MAEKRKDASSSWGWGGGENNNSSAPLGSPCSTSRWPTRQGASALTPARIPPAPAPAPSRAGEAVGTWRRGPLPPARAQPASPQPPPPAAARPRAPSPRKPEKGHSRARRPGTAKKARGRAGWGREANRNEARISPHRPHRPTRPPPAPRHRRLAAGRRKPYPRWRHYSPEETKSRAGDERCKPRRWAGTTDARTWGSTRSRPGAEAPGMVRRGLATHPGSTRGRLSGPEELARSARRQPSLWRHTPPAPTYSPAPRPA